MSTAELSIVIPCYDELANLRAGVLDHVLNYGAHSGRACELIVVDDGSHDGSREFLRAFARAHERIRLIENQHLGKAGAVATGVLAAKGDYILFTDMDQATPIEEVQRLWPFFAQGYDVVIGSRLAVRHDAPLSRRIMATGMARLRIMLVGLRQIHDTQCGFKMFERACARDIFGRLLAIHQGFVAIAGPSVNAGFDVEILYLAGRLGYRIKEVPVRWRYVVSQRVSPLKDSLITVRELARLRLNASRGAYDSGASRSYEL
jgi:dolichyl-phosphate beta-glucosyltransferase